MGDKGDLGELSVDILFPLYPRNEEQLCRYRVRTWITSGKFRNSQAEEHKQGALGGTVCPLICCTFICGR